MIRAAPLTRNHPQKSTDRVSKLLTGPGAYRLRCHFRLIATPRRYSMKTSVGLILFAFLLASCASRDPSFESGVDLLKAATNCKLTDPGTAILNIVGRPTDAYRVIYTCDGVEVTRCIATVPAGQNNGMCNSGPNPIPNNGPKRCIVGPKNGNSALAAVRWYSCI